MRIFLFISFTILISLFSQARDYKKYDKALKLFDQNKYSKSKKVLIKILENDNDWDSPNLLLARILFIEGDILKSLEYMLVAYDKNNPEDKDGIKLIAKLYYQNGYYHKALKYFQIASDFNDNDPKTQLYKKKCIYSIENLGDSITVELFNLGSNINSLYEEYLPAISVDGKTMVFSRRVMESEDYMQEDFYLSVQDTNGDWQPSVLYPGSINTLGNEGAFSFSPNKELVVFTACNREDGEGRCDLYTFYDNKTFNAGQMINTKYWESQACFSPDGNYLYFVSNRPGGFGGKDIWRSKIENNTFLEPENLGPSVNTFFDEMSPYIHPDNLTLYFSSKGHLGFGDFDLFLCRRDSSNQEWGSAINLGYPINSYSIENSLIVLYDGETAYYTSNKSGFGKEDIFMFKLPDDLQANKVSDIEIDIIQNTRGKEIILDNVVFASNSYDIDSISFIQLNQIAKYLLKNSGLTIQIQGHTDNVGNDLDNLILSEKRAESVYNYLLTIVDKKQLAFKGFGELVPIGDNSTSDGRRSNRRTSFIILE